MTTLSTDFNDLARKVHEVAAQHGFWGDGLAPRAGGSATRNFGELIALVMSEAVEALEEYRHGRGYTETYYVGVATGTEWDHPDRSPADLSSWKPCGIPTELADVILRVLDLCGAYGIDIERALLEKHNHNKLRPPRHGGKRA
jgi:NTP pyrophosphatase (non-canonical NTP hydrolase)